MNCNPFTLGHQYLIQEAAAKVDLLYVFVVREDKAAFDFHTRFKMVQMGTKEMDNVVVVAGNKYVLSDYTMPGYFIKEELEEMPIEQYEKDLRIFGAVIAPPLNIYTRFVGEEPGDGYTNGYNKAMKSILPDYEIEVVELPRMQKNGEAISASKVRAALECGEWDKARELLPDSTWKVLEERGIL